MTSAALPVNPFPGMNPYLENPGLWPVSASPDSTV